MKKAFSMPKNVSTVYGNTNNYFIEPPETLSGS